MTKKDKAIEWLTMLREKFTRTEYGEYLDMAIKALKQEPCEDCISRQEVLDQTYLWSKDEFLRVANPFDYLRKRINDLSPVTPHITPKVLADALMEERRT